MSPLSFDVKHKQEQATRLPSVAAWVAAGGKVERIETPPAPPLKARPMFHRPRFHRVAA